MIFPANSVQFVIGHSVGAGNGEITGLKFGIAANGAETGEIRRAGQKVSDA